MSEQSLSLLITQTWQVTVVAMVIWILVRVFAKDRPHLAHALWVLVLVKCLTPPVFSSPTSPFSWIKSNGEQKAEVQIAEQPTPQIQPRPSSAMETIVVQAVPAKPKSTLFPKMIASRPTTQATKAVDPPSVQPIRWSEIAISIWLCGLGTCFLWSTMRYLRFSRQLRTSRELERKDLDDTVKELSKRLKVRRRVRIRVLDHSVGPAVVGLMRPTILFPASVVNGRSIESLRPLIAHELIHVRRGDLYWSVIQLLARCVFWFHPLIWFVVRWVTRESERSCDEETVASLGCRPATYARGLIEVLEQKFHLQAAPAVPGVRPVDITSSRLERVMRLGQGSHRSVPWWVRATTLLVAISVLPGAARMIAQDQEREAPPLPAIGEVYPQPLPQLPRAAFRHDEPSWTVRTYDVDAVLEKIREAEIEEPEAYLLSMIPHSQPGPDGGSCTPNGSHVEISTVDGIISLGNDEPTAKLVNDHLYVFATHEYQAIIEETLSHYEQFGIYQIMVFTRMITMSRSGLNDLGIDWSVSQSLVGESVEASQDWTSIDRHAQILGEERGEAPGVSGTSIIEKFTPTLHSILDYDQMRNLMTQCSEDPGSNILCAPKIVMNSGQNASIVDGAIRPFVVGVEPVLHADGTESDALQPIVRVVNEGVSVNLVGNPSDSGVQLDCQVVLSEVIGVEVFGVSFEDEEGDESGRNIQIPEVAKTVINSSLEVPAEKVLGLCVPRENEMGETEMLLILLECEVMDPNALGEHVSFSESVDDDHKHPERDTEYHIQPYQSLEEQVADAWIHDEWHQDPAVRTPHQGGVESGDLQVRDSGDVRSQHHTHLLIRGDDSETDSAVSVEECVKVGGYRIDIRGDVERQVSDDGVLISGSNLRMTDGDGSGEFFVSAEHCELQITVDDQVKLSCEGNVRLNMGGFEIETNELQLDQSNLALAGGVVVRTDEVELTSESAEFESSGIFRLTGDARLEYHSGQRSPMSVVAEHIKWHSGTHRIEVDDASTLRR